MALFQPRRPAPPRADLTKLPRHVAIIMDGNGRWAKKRGLPRTAGHAAGAETFRTIATYCKEIGLEYLTVYAFSTENWKRPATEVEAIMGLLKKYLLEAISRMERDRVRMAFFGDLSPLPRELLELCLRTEEISRGYEGVQVNICLNYGGRDELLRAAKAYAADCARGRASADKLSEEQFGRYLFSAGVPDPDLVIRPSGEVRISNFLLWQAAYAEFYFTDVLWPDFDKHELHRAIAAYQSRSRRFGGV
ncbi:Isoprenyl transferase [bioreactor metagenome]|uniref:Isoprenyl transferase n=1 Tax=bioreactor metagenome TaxID=1076179 RepID=A0A644ZHM3_9ZZZZ